MSPSTAQVLQAALALPDEERWELLEALIASDNRPDDLPFDPAWMTEIQRRSAQIDSGTVELIPWEVVRERARQRRNGPSGE